MENKKKLFLLDAYALIFRGYYAFIKNPRINSKGIDTSAIIGFTNSLFDIIKRGKPDYLAVCFDKGGSTERIELFKNYKSNRQETPEAIKIAVPYIEKILHSMNIPAIVKKGYEADDIIGTIAKKAEKKNLQTYMVTSDKDFAQLVSDNIFMYKPPRMGNGYEKWGVEEVKIKFEVENPLQVIDYLGMMGDSVDNIPGLPGVGDKTAKKFIKAYGSMENLFKNTDQLKGKMKEKIEANKKLGLLSKKLATIMLNVPVSLDLDKLIIKKPNIEQTKSIFADLEFRRLTEQFLKIYTNPISKNKISEYKKNNNSESLQFDLFSIPGTGNIDKNITNGGFKTIENTNHFYQLVNTSFSRELLLNKILKQNFVCLNTLTSNSKALESELIGISFSWEIGKGYYIALSDDQKKTKQILNEFTPFFENKNIVKIGHNIKYDIKVLSNYNITLSGKLFDTMIAHYLINPDTNHNIDVLAETYLNYKLYSITELIGKKGKNQLSIRDLDFKKQAEYTIEKTDIIIQLKKHLKKELKEGNLTKLFNEIEMPLVSVLSDMEIEGINLNIDILNTLSTNLNIDINNLEKCVFKQAGEKFNIASPKQLGVVLFEKMKLVDKPKKTKTGQYSTSEDILSYLAKEHKIVSNILSYRQFKKLKNTYADALPDEVNYKDNRVHTLYSQAVAATGRLSSNNPNLQNIPIRTKRGQEIRKAFVARDKNYLLLASDYSQIELRIIASLSKEQNMIKAFNEGKDIHADTASKVFNIPIDKITREQRSNAKTVNFGIIYGVSAFGLSNQTNLSIKESKKLIDAYYKAYPNLRVFINKQISFARENGYIETVLGRKRYLKNINSTNNIVRGSAERNAVNVPIQGSAADIIKLAMINIHKHFKKEKFKSKLLLQVHDELVFDIYKKELEIVQPIIKNEMENAFKMLVPLIVDIGIGENWLEAH